MSLLSKDMAKLDDVVNGLIKNKPSPNGRVPAYVSLPGELFDNYKKASAKAGVDMAFILKQAVPIYLDSGIDAAVLREWNAEQEEKSSIVTSIPTEMHRRCAEIAEQEGVALVAVFRAALGQMFEISPRTKMAA